MARLIIGKLSAYALEKEIGSGSFGQVFLVKEQRTQKQFACKIISKPKMQQYNAECMIKTEISIQSKLVHKNILKIIEWFEDPQTIYIILEYCSKGTLKLPTTPMSENEAFLIINQIMCGLDYLHSKSIVHRDLKLENILIHEDGTLKICDFGWALNLTIASPTKVICGTTDYMPPEVVQKQLHDCKVDVWSLGVITHMLLHCKYPFKGASQQILIQDILDKEITVNEELDEDLQIFTQAMLTKDPNDRPTICQLYISKWVKKQMHFHKLFNKYENEEMKAKLKQKNTLMKSAGDSGVGSKGFQCSIEQSLTSSHSTCRSGSTNPCSPAYSRMVMDQIFNFNQKDVEQILALGLPSFKF